MAVPMENASSKLNEVAQRSKALLKYREDKGAADDPKAAGWTVVVNWNGEVGGWVCTEGRAGQGGGGLGGLGGLGSIALRGLARGPVGAYRGFG